MSERRIEELEIRIAYQEQALQALDEALLAQARDIEALRARLGRLEARLERMAGEGPAPPETEVPPHY